MSEQRWAEAARSLRGEADFWSLRVVDERTDEHAVRNDVAEPFKRSRDRGAMLTAWCGAGAGYAATPDLSPAGLQAALDVAIARARAGAAWSLIDHRGAARPRRTAASPRPASTPRGPRAPNGSTGSRTNAPPPRSTRASSSVPPACC